MKAVMKATVERAVRGAVYSSLGSPTMELREAWERGVGVGMLPEEWRERERRVGGTMGGSVFVEG